MHRNLNIKNSLKLAALGDLLRGLTSSDFVAAVVARYGIAGRVLSAAFDPVQLLLALGNDGGEVYIFGTKNVESVFKTANNQPVLHLRFLKNVFLVALTADQELHVFSLNLKRILVLYRVPGEVTAIETDPLLDFVFLGLENGSVIVFDAVNGHAASFKIPNLQRSAAPSRGGSTKILDLAVRSLKIHPRDINLLLIGYAKAAVLYLITEKKIKRTFEYELPPGAPGGDHMNVNVTRHPNLVLALFHPNGLNILTCHEDGSLVFWDTNTGTLIQARTLFDTDVDRPQSGLFGSPVQPMEYTPFVQVAWVCENNPENTALLIAGGDSVKGSGSSGSLNLTRIRFGTTPKYTITSYEKMSAFYANAVNLNIFPVTQQDSIRSFLPLPVASPYFSGNHDPNAILVVLEGGGVEILRYPQGKLVFSALILPPSIAWVRQMTFLSATLAPTTQWTGLLQNNEDRRKKTAGFYGDSLLKGGLAMPIGSRLLSEGRSVFITGYHDGSVKLWDATKSELDESAVIEVDTSIGFGRPSHPSPITKVSFSGYTTELMASNADGDTILYKYGTNKYFDPQVTQEDYDRDLSYAQRAEPPKGNGVIASVDKNVPLYVNKGFLPSVVIRQPPLKSPKRLSVTALKNLHIEFAVVAYNDGQFMVVDRRVNDILFIENVNKISSKRSKTGSLAYVTAIEFAIMKSSEDAKYSSILLLLGTSVGNLITFQILPGSGSTSLKSRFQVKFLSCVDADNAKIRNIIPLNIVDGTSAVAKSREFAQLASGVLIRGLIFTVSSFGVRMFKSPNHKSALVNFQNSQNGEILAADLNRVRSVGGAGALAEASCLSVLFENSVVKNLLVPSLGEINSMQLPFQINRSYGTQLTVLFNGDIVVRRNETEGALVHVTRFGSVSGNVANLAQLETGDLLYNKELLIPPRPVFNSLQWARGLKVVTFEELQAALLGERRLRLRYPEESELAANVIAATAYQAISTSISGNGNNKGSGNTSNASIKSVSRSSTSTSNVNRNTAKKGWGFDMSGIQKSLNNTISGLEDKFTEVGNNVSEHMNETVEGGKNTVLKNLVKSKFSF